MERTTCQAVHGPMILACVSLIFTYVMRRGFCVHVQLIKELLRDGSHPMTSQSQESFTS